MVQDMLPSNYYFCLIELGNFPSLPISLAVSNSALLASDVFSFPLNLSILSSITLFLYPTISNTFNVIYLFCGIIENTYFNFEMLPEVSLYIICKCPQMVGLIIQYPTKIKDRIKKTVTTNILTY